MLVIGLTGGIGSGKSTVADLFAKHGITIIDADAIARQVTNTEHPALQKISGYFGSDILLTDGSLDRTKLKKIIFSEPQKREWLEQLLHPLIRQEMKNCIQTALSPYCIAMIPLLLETSPNPLIDRILIVDTAEEEQIIRIQKRDGVSKIEAESILKAQINREQRLNAAHDIILNHGPLSNLVPQVDKLHKIYLGLSKTS